MTTTLAVKKALETEKKNSRINLAELGSIRKVLHQLGDDAWSHDFQTDEFLFSSDFNSFIGYRSAELTPQKGATIWLESILPEDRHFLMESDEKYKKGLQHHHSLEYRVKDRKGNIHWVLDRGVVVETDEQGTPLVVVGTHTDITELKVNRERLEQLEHARKKDIMDAVIRNMEADRGYMASELHNNINQILVAARMMLELIPMVNEEMGEYTQKVKYIIYNAVDEVNRICNLINPNSLDHVSLPELLKDQIKRAAKEKDIKIRLDINGFLGGKKYPKESELTMLRVVQDVVYRITNYSHATEASIILTQDKDFLHLDVLFNDPKFDVSRTLRNLRVVNLANRCEHYGGSYLMEKEKGNDIRLQASVKIH